MATSRKRPPQTDVKPVVFMLAIPTNGPEVQPRTCHELEPGKRLPPEVVAPAYRHVAALFLNFLESQYLAKDDDLSEHEEKVLFRAWLQAFAADAIRSKDGRVRKPEGPGEASEASIALHLVLLPLWKRKAARLKRTLDASKATDEKGAAAKSPPRKKAKLAGAKKKGGGKKSGPTSQPSPS
jgi:hypothetical protein